MAPTAGARLFCTQEVSPGLGGGTFPAVPKSWAEDKIGEAAGSGDNAGASTDAGGDEKKALATTAEATTVDETDLLLGSPAQEEDDEKKDEEDKASCLLVIGPRHWVEFFFRFCRVQVVAGQFGYCHLPLF